MNLITNSPAAAEHNKACLEIGIANDIPTRLPAGVIHVAAGIVTRRMLFGAAPLAALALAGCGGVNQPAFNPASVARYAQTIATGLSRSLAQISTLNLPGLTPAILDIAQLALTNVQTVAWAIGNVSTVADAQPLVQRIETYVNAFVAALASLPLPAEIKATLTEAAALLPILEAMVDLVVPAKVTAPALK